MTVICQCLQKLIKLKQPGLEKTNPLKLLPNVYIGDDTLQLITLKVPLMAIPA